MIFVRMPFTASNGMARPYSCINNMAKGSKKQQHAFFAVFLGDSVGCTARDIQKTSHVVSPSGKTEDTASAAL